MRSLMLCGFFFIAVVAWAGSVSASGDVRPEAAGVSSQRLAHIDRTMQEIVASGQAAGIVTYLSRNGKVIHLGAYGFADVEAERSIDPDTIFRIASQTKAFTSVAAMMLVEEGRLALSDPVSKFIPQFARTTVAVPKPKGGYDVVAAERPITVHDLLTHTAGISYGEGIASDRWEEAGIQGWYFADREETVSAVVERMAGLPMEAQPGNKFVYGYSTDILGVVIERVTGKTLKQVFTERLIEPLGLRDTTFYLRPDDEDRFTQVYSIQDGKLVVSADPKVGFGHYVDGPRMAFSGGAGLLSTARDYGRFLEMLRRGGTLDGRRYLSAKTVQLMTVNHVGSKFTEADFTPGDTGFGLGFEVVTDLGKSGNFGSTGLYGWGGAYHTDYWVDPVEEIVAIVLTQLRPSTGSQLHTKFQALVYQAIVEAYCCDD